MSHPTPDPIHDRSDGPGADPTSDRDAASTSRPPSRRTLVALGVPVLLSAAGIVAIAADGAETVTVEIRPDGAAGEANAATITAIDEPIDLALLVTDRRSLDGTGNNTDDPDLGAAGTEYRRVAAADYVDGIGEPASGPPERALSNRIFNGNNQNIFSENGVTHWGFVWGQFIDHTIGLRETVDDEDSEEMIIAFDADDPLEDFTNDLGAMTTDRSAVAEGTGVDTPREQVNTISSYIDAWAVYGGTAERLDWLRDGAVDGDPTNNQATLVTVDGHLPTALDRPGTEPPETDLMGRLFGDPTRAVVAGDVRVNENIGLTAVHTLLVREHNRIVDDLPDDLDEETKFAIARRVVAALQQHITYTEFLPAMGVDLPEYAGYDPTVDPTITNEFATVGYRAHSQIHGEFEAEIARAELTDGELASLQAQGVTVAVDDDVVEVAVPLAVAFGNPDLLIDLGLGNVLAGLASEAAYANDEQIDNQLRSVLFQLPGPDVQNPLDCLDGSEIAGCFSSVNDLGALDVLRGYDHGMPSYNEMRVAFGLEPVSTFTDLTGEATEDLPDGLTIDDPEIMDFVSLRDGDGNELESGSDAADGETIIAERRSTTAARLKALFDGVDDVDAFTGMVSEPHVPGTEFGELQLAMWTEQFRALRDGDRFFYLNDPTLDAIAATYGIDYRRSLGEVIAANTDVELADLPASVFLLDDVSDDAATGTEDGPETTATVASRGVADDIATEPDDQPGRRTDGNRPREQGDRRDPSPDRDGRRRDG